jgi:hypothetical protein
MPVRLTPPVTGPHEDGPGPPPQGRFASHCTARLQHASAVARSGSRTGGTPGHVLTLLEESPGLTNAFWRETLIHAAIYREWVENLGSRQALPRVAHLFASLPPGWRWSGCWTTTASACP